MKLTIKVESERAGYSRSLEINTNQTNGRNVFKLLAEHAETLAEPNLNEDEECTHNFGHYANDAYEHCRKCGVRGEEAARER
jgi:hypothetical protein